MSFVIAKPAHSKIIVYCFLSTERSVIIRFGVRFFFFFFFFLLFFLFFFQSALLFHCELYEVLQPGMHGGDFLQGAERREQMEK